MSPTFFTINVFWCFLSGISYLCCWTASATDLRKLFFTLRYLWHYTPSRGGSRTAAASKVELFVIIVNGWKPLTIITKSSTLDIAAVLDPSLPSLHFLQYRECYGFERAFFTLRRFLPYTPSRYLAQPAFIKASLGVGSFSLKTAGPTTEFRNIDPVDLFLWITQFSENRISQ